MNFGTSWLTRMRIAPHAVLALVILSFAVSRLPWGSEVFWCQRNLRGDEADKTSGRDLSNFISMTSFINVSHFRSEGCSSVRIQTHSTKTYSPDQFCCVCQCYIVVFGRGKCNIFSGKISNELVQITDDNRQIRLF